MFWRPGLLRAALWAGGGAVLGSTLLTPALTSAAVLLFISFVGLPNKILFDEKSILSSHNRDPSLAIEICLNSLTF